jgi:CheY-like chemotaxis protein
MFFEAALQKTSPELIWAGDGLEALNAIKVNPDVDVILMDMRLPNMDGFEATKRIKDINNNIPIIAQTTYILPDEKELIFNAGCDDYLPKPIRFESLLHLLAKFLGPGN